jgi:hypothetical protein
MKFSAIASLFIIASLLSNPTIFAQEREVGGSFIYNLQTKSIGLDLRTEIPIKQYDILEGLTLAPQISYYPGFNNVHEFYIGTSIHVGVYSYDKWKVYGLANLSYNGWIDYKDSGMENAKFSNIGFEGGVGITNDECIRPFFEYRYNIKWKEASIRLGVIYSFNCEKRGQVPCSKIPNAPYIE